MSDVARTGVRGFHEVDEVVWELRAEARSDMRVPARVFADRELIGQIAADRSLEQLQNMATPPGITGAALAMPDIHQGYGFPVGGVAATEPPDGIVSPGGVGYDINCGVRLLALLAEHGIGTAEDVEHTESEGCLEGADPETVSERARLRGADQLGTLGSGNHFLELQRVAKVLDAPAADVFGLRQDQVTVLIHSGSRGFGHQVCSDYVRAMDAVQARYHISLPDRQLACALLSSPEGRRYLAAMACAANFAWGNRALLAHRVRESVAAILGPRVAEGTRQVYDVAHNVAKLETQGGRVLCVHRKGATRAFPAGSAEIPNAFREVGQPVFIPGSMGTSSFVLVGRPGAMERSFGTTCHGAGRRISRTGARKKITGAELRHQLEAQGIVVRCPSDRGLAEEAPFAYKDVERVVAVVERAGLAGRVAQLLPLGVVKG
jgi:tRNA-splicing ligase RtcB (3'-phosphate/5'-hydroxy nucleic acid ligase)